MIERQVNEHLRVHGPDEDHVGVVEMLGVPNHFVDIRNLTALVEALHTLDSEPDCRAIVVRTAGKHFCAGRDFTSVRKAGDTSEAVYSAAVGLLTVGTPWVAELTGGSIGAGMGLALCADTRVAAETAYLHCNFVRLGLHPGFGTTATLPRLVGPHRATELMTSGRRVSAPEALHIGLVDHVARPEDVEALARQVAGDAAALAPLALAATRSTMRQGLVEQFAEAVGRELAEQVPLTGTRDFLEAAAAVKERRAPVFTGD